MFVQSTEGIKPDAFKLFNHSHMESSMDNFSRKQAMENSEDSNIPAKKTCYGIQANSLKELAKLRVSNKVNLYVTENENGQYFLTLERRNYGVIRNKMTLTEQQWLGMMSVPIDDCIQKSAENEYHIGGDLYVEITADFVIIRKHRFVEDKPESIKTNFYFALNHEQWREFSTLEEIVKTLAPKLRGLHRCSDDHQNQQGALECYHCSPRTALFGW